MAIEPGPQFRNETFDKRFDREDSLGYPSTKVAVGDKISHGTHGTGTVSEIVLSAAASDECPACDGDAAVHKGTHMIVNFGDKGNIAVPYRKNPNSSNNDWSNLSR